MLTSTLASMASSPLWPGLLDVRVPGDAADADAWWAGFPGWLGLLAIVSTVVLLIAVVYATLRAVRGELAEGLRIIVAAVILGALLFNPAVIGNPLWAWGALLAQLMQAAAAPFP